MQVKRETYHDGALATVRKVEVTFRGSEEGKEGRARHAPEGLEGVAASNVRVKDKEWRVVLAKDVASKRKRTSWATISTQKYADNGIIPHQCQEAQSPPKS